MSCKNLLSRNFDEDDDEGDGDIELSLGLSLNGRFGVDPVQTRKITKSASIANFILSEGCSPLLPPSQGNFKNLLRTCSLPVENEEERRRKKDMQTLRRMEAKRKRSEKQHHLKCSKVTEEDVNGVIVKPSSQGSIGSQGSGSSGLSETDSLINDEFERKPVVSQGQVQLRRGDSTTTRSVIEAMPHVSTRGLGPNGRRIEGFLYQFQKGEEVRIVCVCHGTFHTPSEFVRHAGGADVTHPLRHIVVDPNPGQLL